MDTGCQSMDLFQSHKTKMDTRCQSMDLYQSPETKQNKDTRCQPMDLYQSPRNDHRKQLPIAGLTIDSSQETNNKCNKQEETSCQ
jgi:hypothetical protein